MRRVFKIEQARRARLRSDLPGKGCLSYLSSADQTDDRSSFQGRCDPIKMALPGNHMTDSTLKIHQIMANFRGGLRRP